MLEPADWLLAGCRNTNTQMQLLVYLLADESMSHLFLRPHLLRLGVMCCALTLS
jgi:hypothetical protein